MLFLLLLLHNCPPDGADAEVALVADDAEPLLVKFEWALVGPGFFGVLSVKE